MDDPGRDDKGRFAKGHSGNPNGRPMNPWSDKITEAISEVEQEKTKTLVRHFIERAYESDTVLAVVFRKLLPDLRAIEANIIGEKKVKAIEDEQARIEKAIAIGQALDDAPDALADGGILDFTHTPINEAEEGL